MTNAMKHIRTVGIAFLAMLLMLVCLPTYTLQTAAAGKVYYVAADGSDSNDGLSQDSPLSFSKANSTIFFGGDKVLFKRGDTFYGQFDPIVYSTTNTSRVEVGAYGTGAKPILSNAKVIRSAWQKAGAFYRFNLSADGNYDGVKNDAVQVGFMVDSKGNKYYKLKASAADCTSQYDFYCDENQKCIYVKTDKDPYAALGELTLAMDGPGDKGGTIVFMSPGMNIHDLHLKNGGGHGMSWTGKVKRATCKFVKVYDCVIEDVGGAELDRSGGDIIRYGNGIELYGAGDSVTIENNIFRNAYDVAFTCQGDSPGVWRNVTVQNNIFAYNTQSLEIWCGNSSQGAGIQSLYFRNNLCINQGMGWGYDARPEKWQATDVLAYGYTPSTWRMYVENNTFYHPTNIAVYCIHGVSMDPFVKGVTIDKNNFYQLNANSLTLHTTDSGTAQYKGRDDNFETWKSTFNKDAGSTWTAIGANRAKYTNMEKLALASTDFDTIAQAAKDAGVQMSLTFSKPTATKKTTTTTKTKATTTNAATTGQGTVTTTTAPSGNTTGTTADAQVTEGDAATTTVSNQQTQGNPTDANLLPVLIGIGAAVVIAAGVVVTILILKKRKNTAK